MIFHVLKPKRFRYSNTRDAAWRFLIENKVTSYPLNLRSIVKSNGWLVADIKQAAKMHPELRKQLGRKEVATISQGGKIIILIDRENSVQRNRFSIAHEIGHVYLQHCGLTKRQAEKEANMFAARILMPMILIKELHIDTAEQLASVCNVSIEAASYRMKRYHEVKKRRLFETSPLERKLKKQLREFIKEQK